MTLRRWDDVHAGGESCARAGEGVTLEKAGNEGKMAQEIHGSLHSRVKWVIFRHMSYQPLSVHCRLELHNAFRCTSSIVELKSTGYCLVFYGFMFVSYEVQPSSGCFWILNFFFFFCEGGSNENLKSATKIRKRARFSVS